MLFRKIKRGVTKKIKINLWSHSVSEFCWKIGHLGLIWIIGPSCMHAKKYESTPSVCNERSSNKELEFDVRDVCT